MPAFRTGGPGAGLFVSTIAVTAAAADTTTEPAAVQGNLLAVLRDLSGRLSDRIERLAEAPATLPAEVERLVANLTDLEGWARLPRAGWIFAVMLVAAFAVEALMRRLPGEREGRAAGLSGRLLAFAIDMVLLVVFALVAYGASFLFLARFDPMRELVMAGALWVVALRFLIALADLLADLAGIGAPGDPGRVVRARRLLRTALGGLGGGVAFIVLSSALLDLLGLSEPLSQLYRLAAGTVIVIGGLVLAAVIGADAPADAAGRRVGRAAWIFISTAMIALVWLVWAGNLLLDRELEARTAITAGLVVLTLPAVEFMTRSFLLWLARLREGWETPAADAADRQRIGVAGRAILGILRGVTVAAALGLIGEAAGLGVAGAIDTSLGRTLVRAAFNIAVAVLIALTVWEFVSALVGSRLASERRDEGASAAAVTEGEGGTATAATRAETLLPLLRSFLLAVLVAIVGMIALSSLGVDIGPLLAGAGVVGIAIGFGAQTLVRDVVSGVFFLIDDAFRLGEYIEMGGIRGEVEKISIRSLRLRHHRGAIHTIPFGELKSITNYNRDWVIYKFSIQVTYDTDIDKVRKIIKAIGAEMMTHPEHGRALLEPLKSQGVTEFGAHALTIRVKFKCRPREQFVLRRVAHQRIRDEFFRHGIEFAYPTVTVQGAGGEAGGVASAAREALAQATPAETAKP